jgi:hypothetical protein
MKKYFLGVNKSSGYFSGTCWDGSPSFTKVHSKALCFATEDEAKLFLDGINNALTEFNKIKSNVPAKPSDEDIRIFANELENTCMFDRRPHYNFHSHGPDRNGKHFPHVNAQRMRDEVDSYRNRYIRLLANPKIKKLKVLEDSLTIKFSAKYLRTYWSINNSNTTCSCCGGKIGGIPYVSIKHGSNCNGTDVRLCDFCVESFGEMIQKGRPEFDEKERDMLKEVWEQDRFLQDMG